MAKALFDYRVYTCHYPELLRSLAKTQPIAFLDEFLSPQNCESYGFLMVFSDERGHRSNPIDVITDDVLLSWCDRDPIVRYEIVAAGITPFRRSADTRRWNWEPIVLTILDRAPRVDRVFKRLSEVIWPTTWSGSRADIVASRTVLFSDLFQHKNPEVQAWAKTQYADLQEQVKQERKREEGKRYVRTEAFE